MKTKTTHEDQDPLYAPPDEARAALTELFGDRWTWQHERRELSDGEPDMEVTQALHIVEIRVRGAGRLFSMSYALSDYVPTPGADPLALSVRAGWGQLVDGVRAAKAATPDVPPFVP